MNKKRPAIMVIDDVAANLELLEGILASKYDVRPFLTGELGLRSMRNERADLLLLDINMPHRDGFDICRELKSDPELQDIPVIFITAMTSAEDKVKAFSMGAVDYVTKPFQFEEVLARVDTHLQIQEYRLTIQRQNQLLQEQLSKVNTLQAMRDQLTSMIIHDLRSPLTVIKGCSQLIQMNPESPQLLDRADQIDRGAENILRLVNNLLDINRMEEAAMPITITTCNLAELAEQVAEVQAPRATQRQINIELELSSVDVLGDAALLERIIDNLLCNALKFSPPQSTVRVITAVRDGMGCFCVQDQGPGIPDDRLESIFDKFSQVRSAGGDHSASSGLGLTFCRLAVESQSGTITARNQVVGSEFQVQLPLRTGHE